MDLTKYVKDNHLKVYVKPNSKKTELLGFSNEKDAVLISVKEPAEDNKANLAILKFLKKLLKKDVRIAKGLKSKEKILKL